MENMAHFVSYLTEFTIVLVFLFILGGITFNRCPVTVKVFLNFFYSSQV